MPTETVSETADRIAREHRDRIPFRPLPADLVGDMSHAYAAQDMFIARKQKLNSEAIFGWKVGLTTKRMQAFCGVDEPVVGAIFASLAKMSPAHVPADRFQRLGVEMELALQLASPLPDDTVLDGPVVAACIGQVCAAFEIVEDRAADYAALDAASLVADNSWNAGVVLGPPSTLADLGGLIGRQGVLHRDGALLGVGRTEDAGGDPLEVVAWLASALRTRGHELRPGQWVMTGSVVPTQFAKSGETYHFEIEGLGRVTLTT